MQALKVLKLYEHNPISPAPSSFAAYLQSTIGSNQMNLSKVVEKELLRDGSVR
jgi:hypothetical protein